MSLKKVSIPGKITALAVAGLISGAAFAEGGLTLYGLVDLGYTYSRSDFRKFSGIENGLGIEGDSSHLGIEGEEDLGNGLKALFKLEWDIEADEGSAFTSRYTYVGLTSKLGTVTMGRNGSPSDMYFGDTASMGLTGNEPINLFRGAMPIIDGERWDNSIAYVSPEFSGLEFAVVYSFGERVNESKKTANGYLCDRDNDGNPQSYCKGAKTTDAGRFGFGARYENGPLYLTAVYHVMTNNDGARFRDGTGWAGDEEETYGASGWGIGASYDFDVVQVYTNYFRAKAKHGGLAYSADDGGSDKQTTWSVGLGLPVSSAGTVSLEYAQYKDSLNGALRSEDDLDGRKAGHKAKGYSIGYKHELSKRTHLYTYVSRIDNERGIDVGWDKTNVTGEKQTNFSMGIVHAF